MGIKPSDLDPCAVQVPEFVEYQHVSVDNEKGTVGLCGLILTKNTRGKKVFIVKAASSPFLIKKASMTVFEGPYAIYQSLFW